MGLSPETSHELLQLAAETLGGCLGLIDGAHCRELYLAEGLERLRPQLEGAGLLLHCDGALRARLATQRAGRLRGTLTLEDGRYLLEGHLSGEGHELRLSAQLRTPAQALQTQVEALGRSIEAVDFPMALCRAEPPHDCLYVNSSFQVNTGYSAAELRGRNLAFLQKEEAPYEVRQEIRAALSDGRGCQVLLPNYRKDGSRYLTQLSLLPLFGPDGESLSMYLGFNRDVTAEAADRVRLHRERSLLAEAERVAGCGSWEFDASSGEVWWSEGIYALTGWPSDRPAPDVATQRNQMFDPEQFDELMRRLQRCIETGEPYGFDIQLRVPERGTIWVHARGRRVSPPGAPAKLVGTLQDVQARKETEAVLARARQDAEEAGRAKAQFLANMSHEIRTPLNGVLGAATLLDGARLGPEERELVRTIRSSGEALLSLLNDVLDFSKIEAGQLVLERVPFDVEGVLEEVAQLFVTAASARGTRILVELDPDVPSHIHGDPTRLRQVVSNLVGNAVKFTSEGTIRLRVAGSRKDRLRVEVEDDGIGIPAEVQGRLFKPFIQADNSTSRRFGGTGLGLSISRHLVRKMGGDLTVRSEPGVGSCFTLEIDATPASRSPARSILGGHRVALVGLPAPEQVRVERALTEAGARIVDEGSADVRVTAGDVCDPKASVHLWPGAPPSDAPSGPVHLVSPVRRSGLLDAVASLVSTDAEASAPTVSAERFDAVRVLVVDDNAVNRKIAGRLLERVGVSVALAEGGLEAVAACEQEAFHLVLMDIQMPEVDGYQATQMIRERLEAPPPIVALTANALAQDRKQAFDIGMDGYLTKPVRLDDLKNLLREHAPRSPSENADR